MATGMNDYNSRKRFAFDVDMEIETEPTSRIKAGEYDSAAKMLSSSK